MVSVRIHSLTTRFLLTLLLSTALPFLAFGWYARVEMESRLESQVVQVFLPDQAAEAANEIEARLLRFEQGAGTLRNDLMELLRTGDTGDFEMTVDLAPQFDPDIALLVDGTGGVLRARLSRRLDPKTVATLEKLIPDSVRDLEWYRQISREEKGKVWENRHLSRFLHKTAERVSLDPADYSLGLAFHVPTKTSGEPGAVYCLMPWSDVQRVLDEAAAFLQDEAEFGSAEVFLCDGEGRYLAHTDREKYGGQFRLPGELLAALPSASEAVECAFTAGTQERRAGLAALGFPGLDWWVGLDAPADELLATSRELSDVLLLVTVVTALILVAWSVVASRGILRPVRRLADATEKVARGDLSVRVPARGKHELAELGRAFNQMAEDLDKNGRQLRNAERQAAWAEMARQIAHEIKNPLTPMRMSAQLLLRAKLEDDDRVAELTDRLARTVLEQTDALSKIASDFRQFAGPPSRQLELVVADDFLRDAAEFFGAMAEASEVQLGFRPGAGAARILVDREELRRVFLNLIHNAFAACGDRGRVDVSSERLGARIIFRVQDDGGGIDAEARSKLFDPYFTTKSSGTGLGLAICRKILESYRGRIELESSGAGLTVFRCEIPVTESPG